MTAFLHRPPTPLPSQSDFDPVGCDLDAQSAWQTFGGLGLAEAYAKFLQVPESYQEDFMFMGSRAFAYYFPVVDRYPPPHSQQSQARRTKLRCFFHGRLPNNFGLNRKIRMGQNITKPRDLTPRHFRLPLAQLIRDSLGGFTDDFKDAHHGVLSFEIALKFFPIVALHIHRQPVTGLDNVVQS